MADPNELRSQMILKDIYARHGIDPSLPIDEQLAAVRESAAKRGYVPSAWANPEERARARASYAARGKTDKEKEDRWGESAYLLDPDTYQYQQNAGRDIDFLSLMDQHRQGMKARESQPQRPVDPTGMDPWAVAQGVDQGYTKKALADAVHYWDSSNGSPVYRDSWTKPNYESQSSLLSGLLNATTNPDVPSGQYLNFSEVPADRIRMGGSGEAETGQEAYEAAQAKRMATNRYRLQSLSPVLDLPDGADVAAKDNRIRELQGLTKKADIPEASQRWARTMGFVPPGWVTDPIDFAISWVDPTALIPAGTMASGAAKVGMKGAKVAGGGWAMPLLHNLASKKGKDFFADMGVEQGIGHGISGSTGGRPDRSWSEWALGDWSDPKQKSEADVAASRQARTQLYDQLKDDDRVSRADSEAYKDLGLRVHVPYPYR